MINDASGVKPSYKHNSTSFVKMHRDLFRLPMFAGRSPLRQALIRTLVASPYKTAVPGFTRCTLKQLADAMGYCPRLVRAELNKLEAEGEVVFDYWKTGFLLLEDMKRCPPRTAEQAFRWGQVLHYLSETTYFMSFTGPLLELIHSSCPHLYQRVAAYFGAKFLCVRHYLDARKMEKNVNNKVHSTSVVDNSAGLRPMAQLSLIAPADQGQRRIQKAEGAMANCARRLRELLGVGATRKARAPQDVKDWQVWWAHVPGLKGQTRSRVGKQVAWFRQWLERGVSLQEVQQAVDVALKGGRLGEHSCLLAYANGILGRWRDGARR